MTYAEALARLTALRGGEHAGMRPGLERIDTLLDALGRPERRYRLVHVGGTNGKGSVAAMTAAILHAAGRRVGLYTSPHLVSFRERIRVNGAPIAEDAVADGVDAIATLVARLDATMFEATTALALDYFAAQEVEVAVLEVGLGGRLDATTVGVPAATVITRIDLDHQEVLGDTLAAIAAEKAAILRAGVAFSAAQPPEAAAVVVAQARARQVPLAMEGRELAVSVRARSLADQRVDLAAPGWRLDDVALALLGVYQPSNALLAAAAARALGAGDGAIRAGLTRVRWPGRFEVRRRGERTLVLDGAHNVGGARALADSLRTYFPDADITLVFGCSRDKDARAMLDVLAPLARRLVLTAAASVRATDPGRLRALVPRAADARVAGRVAEALELARAAPAPPIVCVAGSLFVVGEALAALDGPDKPCPVEKLADSIRPLL